MFEEGDDWVRVRIRVQVVLEIVLVPWKEGLKAGETESGRYISGGRRFIQFGNLNYI